LLALSQGVGQIESGSKLHALSKRLAQFGCGVAALRLVNLTTLLSGAFSNGMSRMPKWPAQ